MKRSPLTRSNPEKFIQRGRESSSRSLRESGRKAARKNGSRPRAISPASPEQRAARDEVGYCIACGATAEFDGVPIDPAHIVARAQGGCDSRFCTIPLCRRCHDRLDGRAQPPINMLGVLVGDWDRWRHHYQHALTHELPAYVFERLAGARTQWSDA